MADDWWCTDTGFIALFHQLIHQPIHPLELFRVGLAG
jgi:hypothetical protein